MDGHGRDEVSRRSYSNKNNQISVTSEEELIMDEDEEVKRGPWTVEEDFTLINYVAHHGEGRWNSLARCAGLKRTGKSCRLRWLNYLHPDVRRGNITLEEQLLILELHSRWGNRWSKIAQHLPGRTDNEIKNYWRTRVQKQAKQLKCDVNSKQFKDAMRYLWMPRLIERIQLAAAKPKTTNTTANYNLNMTSTINPELSTDHDQNIHVLPQLQSHTYAPENSSSDSFGTAVSDLTESSYNNYTTLNDDHGRIIINNNNNIHHHHQLLPNYADHDQSSTHAGYFNQEGSGFVEQNTHWPIHGGDVSDNFWDNIDDIWFLHHQFNLNV